MATIVMSSPSVLSVVSCVRAPTKPRAMMILSWRVAVQVESSVRLQWLYMMVKAVFSLYSMLFGIRNRDKLGNHGGSGSQERSHEGRQAWETRRQQQPRAKL